MNLFSLTKKNKFLYKKKHSRFDVQILDFSCENFCSVLLFSLTKNIIHSIKLCCSYKYSLKYRTIHLKIKTVFLNTEYKKIQDFSLGP